MKSTLRIALATLIILAGIQQGQALAKSNKKEYSKIEKTLLKHLDEKAKFSGTLDLFDEGLGKVRNLKLIQSRNEISVDGDKVTAYFDFRDVNSAELVVLKVLARDGKKGVAIDDIQVEKVETFKEEEDADAKAELTDEEAHEVMKEYINAQSKFTGYYSYFDIKKEIMRKLELVEIKDEVRRYGALYLSDVIFKDMDSKETLTMVFTVQYRKGKKKVKSVRVDKIKKPKKD